MSAPRDPDAIIAAWLDDGPNVLPEPTRRAIGVTSRSTNQARRPLRLPWRETDVNSFLKLALAGAAVVAVAVGGLYLINRGPAGPGSIGGPTPTPSPSLAAPPTPASSPETPGPSEIAPGITGFTPYTSELYGITLGYPDGWTLYAPATQKWPASDEPVDGISYSDTFVNPSARDGDEIALGVWQMPAGSGADITSREGLAAWFQANRCDDEINACDTVPDVAMPMCAGKTACLPAILVPLFDGTEAVIADAEAGLVTVVALAREDDFPAAARYGGGVQLLKSVLTTMDVWPPAPGQVPSP